MAKMFNRARMTVTSTGTGALSLGVAVAGYQTFSSAGAQNGDSVSYAVEDGLKWEIGTGQYNSVAGTLSRTVTQSFDGTTYGISPISVTTSAQVFISPLAADLQYGTSAGNLVQLDGSARLPAVDGSLVTGLNASNISSGTIAAARVPTLNQNTTGTAANVTGTVAVANGGTGLTSLTAGYIPYGNGTGAFSNSSTFRFDGVNLGVGAAPTNYGGGYTGFWVQGSTGGVIDLSTAGTRVGTFLNTSTDVTIGSISTVPFIFKTSNVERMRIASDGSVGIGTSSPGYKLDVTGAIRSSNAGNGNVWLSDGTYQSSLQQNSTDLYLNANAGGAANGGFIWRSSNSYTTRMTLDASGNLGLGVTPSAWDSLYRVFQIGGNPALASDQAGQWVANAYYNAGWKYISNNYAARYEINKSNGGIHAWYNAPSGTAGNPITFTQAMTLDASGNLGVADTSPSSYGKLSVIGNATINLSSAAYNASLGTLSLNSLNNGSNNKSAAVLRAYAASGSYTAGIFSQESIAGVDWRGSTCITYMADGAGGNFLLRQFNPGTNTTATNLVVDNYGNVGIGTNNNPIAKLDVYGGSGAVTTTIRAASGQNAFLSVMGNGNAFLSTSFDIIQDSTNAAQIFQRANGPLLFGTNNTERARFNAGAPILCLSGGNTGATGTGIAFPATQSASSDVNTLDDYEEGNWTPSITLSTGTASSISTNATYTKVGRLVQITFNITINGGSSVGTPVITNLPFTPAANSSSGTLREGTQTGIFWGLSINGSSTSAYIFRYDNSSTLPNGTTTFAGMATYPA